jgi:hypothetical protein
MQPRFHAVVQHADKSRRRRVASRDKDHMHRVRDWRLAIFVPAVANVEAANAGKEFDTIDGRTSVGVACNAAHGGGEAGAIADAGLPAVLLVRIAAMSAFAGSDSR